MNEDKDLQNLFQRLESNVTASDDLRRDIRLKITKPKRWRLTMAGGLAAALTVSAGVLLLTPASSTAATIKRMEAAIKGVKAMHVRSYSDRPGRPRVMFSELFCLDGSWRSDAFPGQDLERIYIRSGGRQSLYLACNDVSVVEPQMQNELEGAPSAIEFAKMISDEGRSDTPRQYKVEPRPNEGGKEVYAIVGWRSDTPYHLELIVDKATNLPIRSEFKGEEQGSENYQVLTEEYSYNDPISPSKFDTKIKPTTKVIDLPAEADRLKATIQSKLLEAARTEAPAAKSGDPARR